MTTRHARHGLVQHPLGTLGLFLVVLTGWAVERQQTKSRVNVLIARLALTTIALIGSIVDRFARLRLRPESDRKAVNVRPHLLGS